MNKKKITVEASSKMLNIRDTRIVKESLGKALNAAASVPVRKVSATKYIRIGG